MPLRVNTFHPLYSDCMRVCDNLCGAHRFERRKRRGKKFVERHDKTAIELSGSSAYLRGSPKQRRAVCTYRLCVARVRSFAKTPHITVCTMKSLVWSYLMGQARGWQQCGCMIVMLALWPFRAVMGCVRERRIPLEPHWRRRRRRLTRTDCALARRSSDACVDAMKMRLELDASVRQREQASDSSRDTEREK